MLCAVRVNYAATSGRTDCLRYGPAFEIVDRPSANLARSRRTKTVSQAWKFQILNESTQASRAYRRAPPAVDPRPEPHPVNWFESIKSPQANLAIHAITMNALRSELLNAYCLMLCVCCRKYLMRASAHCAGQQDITTRRFTSRRVRPASGSIA